MNLMRDTGVNPKMRHSVDEIEAAKAANFNKKTINCNQRLATGSIAII